MAASQAAFRAQGHGSVVMAPLLGDYHERTYEKPLKIIISTSNELREHSCQGFLDI